VASVRFALLTSGGKDSLFAGYFLAIQGWEPTLFIKILPHRNDSYMFHTVNLHVVEKQAECARLPLATVEVSGEKEREIKEFASGLAELRKQYGFDSLVAGGVSSEYQRVRLDMACEEAGLKCFLPLWHKNEKTLFEEYLDHNFKFVFSGVYALGFDQTWVGRVIGREDLERLVRLNKRYGVNIVGEGGEYESLVLDCPLFQSERLCVSGRVERLGPYSYEFKVSVVKTVPKHQKAKYVEFER